VAGCCECGDEPSGFGATELVNWGYFELPAGNSYSFACGVPVYVQHAKRIVVVGYWLKK
jgi:hypothetical protein